MDYSMMMPFLEQEPMFAHGFECGRIWEKIEGGFDFDGYLCHTVNNRQIEMMLTRAHYAFRIEVADDTWSRIFGKIDLSKAN